MSTKKKHEFQNVPIAGNSFFAYEPCINCELISKRYTDGSRVYPNGNQECGSKEPYNIFNSGSYKSPAPVVQPAKPAAKEPYITLPSKLNTMDVVTIEVDQELDEEFSARVGEAMVLLHLATNDLPRRSKAKRMIDTYLASDGYTKLVSHLNQTS